MRRRFLAPRIPKESEASGVSAVVRLREWRHGPRQPPSPSVGECLGFICGGAEFPANFCIFSIKDCSCASCESSDIFWMMLRRWSMISILIFFAISSSRSSSNLSSMPSTLTSSSGSSVIRVDDQTVKNTGTLFKTQQCFHRFARAGNKYICSQAVASSQRRRSYDHLARADTNKWMLSHGFESCGSARMESTAGPCRPAQNTVPMFFNARAAGKTICASALASLGPVMHLQNRDVCY